MKIKILNKKEVKRILKLLKEQYCINDLNLDCIVILGAEDKIYLVNKKFADLDTSKLRINSVGMYFGKLQEGYIRLSIEGSQLVGHLASKNIVTLSKKGISEWITGDDLSIDSSLSSFVLVKYGNDFYGCGKCSNSKLLNFIPKSRRIKVKIPSLS